MGNMRIVRLGGADRELRYSSEAVRRYEIASGKSILINANTEIQMTEIMNMLWAGLLWNNQRLTTRGVEAWIDQARAEGIAPTDFLENILYTLADDGWYGKAGDSVKKALIGDETEEQDPTLSLVQPDADLTH